MSVQPGLWSIRCYRMLMHLYPREFRGELGDSIDQAFRDLLRDAFRKRGYAGIALLWFRILPDFVFSVFELLTSNGGDYLKWYFRLRWALACSLGLATGQLIAGILNSIGVAEFLGMPRIWVLAGLPLWLCMGLFQAKVLTKRLCNPARWVVLTAAGGVLGIVSAAAIFSFVAPVSRLHLDSWGPWLVFAGRSVIVGAAIGFFQCAAFKAKSVSLSRWVLACSFGAYLVQAFGVPFSNFLAAVTNGVFDELTPWSLLRLFFYGGIFGLITAGSLKRILWPQSAEALPAELPDGRGAR